MKDSYRVNFGNGQVHYAGSLRGCLNFVKQHGDGFSFIQFRDHETGEWLTWQFAHTNEDNERFQERFQEAMEQDHTAEHKWTGVQRGGSPSDADSYEWVRFCEACGIEDNCEDPLPPCTPKP